MDIIPISFDSISNTGEITLLDCKGVCLSFEFMDSYYRSTFVFSNVVTMQSAWAKLMTPSCICYKRIKKLAIPQQGFSNYMDIFTAYGRDVQ